MQAIITKNLPFTEHKPTRVKATTGNGEHSFTLSVGKLEGYLTENNRTQENIHRVCADLLSGGASEMETLYQLQALIETNQ